MSDALTAVFLSLAAVLLLEFLFRVERAWGRRFFSFAREHLDYYLLKIAHAFLKFYRSLSRDVLRQIVHYFFHTLLKRILELLGATERKVKDIMRSNRSFAKRSEHERATRNKLEEIALHKMEVALTDEEKRRHKEKSLHG
jgi:hypothetical protein